MMSVWSDHMLPKVKSFTRTTLQTASTRSLAVQSVRLGRSYRDADRLPVFIFQVMCSDNLKTAKAMNFTVPNNVLSLADEVIE